MNKLKILSVILIFLLFASTSLFSQNPPPPPPEHGETGNQNGGNAPIGAGLYILLGLGGAYGVKKVLGSEKEKIEK